MTQSTGAMRQAQRDIDKRMAVRAQYLSTPRVKVAARQHFRRQQRLVDAERAKALAKTDHVEFLAAFRAKRAAAAQETI